MFKQLNYRETYFANRYSESFLSLELNFFPQQSDSLGGKNLPGEANSGITS